MTRANPGRGRSTASGRRFEARPAGGTTDPRSNRRPGRDAGARGSGGGGGEGRATVVELTFLPGLGDVVAAEIDEVLRPAKPAAPAPGRDDALVVTLQGPLADVRRLRTAVAAFVSLHFDVPRPKSLVSGEHLPRIVDAVYASLRVAGSSSFRFEAAGSDSAVFARLAQELRQATGLKYDERDGELVVRVRRGPRRGDADPGWDVLVRVGPRPLSARAWRVADYPGAVNATIAAAMVRLGGVRDDQRVINLCCGSGTLLIERLLAGPAAAALGLDTSDDALAIAADNTEAAGLKRAVRLTRADATAPTKWPTPAAPSAAPGDDGWDLVLADPPWGGLHGSHADAERLHGGLLTAAHKRTADGARFVVLTHEVKVMQRCLRAAAGQWRVADEVRVFAKGHHPRIWVLDRVG